MRRALGLAVPFFLLAAAGCSSAGPADDPGPTEGGRLAIDIAALELPGVVDACWTVTVENGAATPQTVFTRTISSGQFGDGLGSASYVGTCDASPGVELNTVTVDLHGIYDVGGVDCAAPPASLPFDNPSPLTRQITCVENEDVFVQFDVSIMRPANQGFFDIAVNFGEIYCSAKLDCCDDAGGNDDGTCDADEHLTLLHDGNGVRNSTVVLGFACAAGDASAHTILYMDKIRIVCDGVEVASVNPDAQGNLCQASTDTCTGVVDDQHDLLYQAAVYRGAEQFTGVDKAYWNVALGLNTANFPAGQVCRLEANMTADDNNTAGGAQGGLVPAGHVYPAIAIDVNLTDGVNPPFACTDNPLNGSGSGTTTTYTTTNGPGVSVTYCYDPDGACSSCACYDDNGDCDPSGAACLSCGGFGESFATDPLANGWTAEGEDGPTDSTTVWVNSAPFYFQLTDEAGDERGTLHNDAVVIPAGQSSISFDFRFVDGGAGSADGMALTIVNTDPADLATLISGTEDGGGIGYHYPDAITNGLATAAVTVELDTFYNTPSGFWGEPAETFATDHIAVHADLNSRPSGEIAAVSTPVLNDGAWHKVRVLIDGTNLEIFLDGTSVLSVATGFTFAGGLAFFSAATGSQADQHDIDSVALAGGCDCAGDLVYVPAFAMPGAGAFSLPGHGLSDGQAVTLVGGDAQGLTPGATFYVEYVDTDGFTLWEDAGETTAATYTDPGDQGAIFCAQ